jgi:hypothetical protein
MALNSELDAIKTSVDALDFDTARAQADIYVTANPDSFTDLHDKDIPALVQAVDALRAAGLDEQQWRVEAWLLHRFEPQNIGGTSQPRLRIPGVNAPPPAATPRTAPRTK